MLALRRCRSLFDSLKIFSVASESIVLPAHHGQKRTNSASANTNFFIREVTSIILHPFRLLYQMWA